MPRKFNISSVKDPRVLMRVLIGILLAANLAVAVVAFHPFGGSADDLRRARQRLSSQLAQAENRLAASKRLVEKVRMARTEGDKFLGEYFMDIGTVEAIITEE